MKKTLLLAAASIISMQGYAAQAQDDVLVMRRAVAPDKNTSTSGEMKPVEGSDTTGHYWVVSDWLQGESMCTPEETQSRLRGCVFQGRMAPEQNCPQPAPSITQVVPDYSACQYQWQITSKGPWQAQCSETTRSVSAECRRQDGSLADESACAVGPRPTQERGFNEEGCSYAWSIGDWGNWDSACKATATRRRQVNCTRPDGTSVSESKCSEAKPETSESAANYTDCEYRWVPTEWKVDVPACGQQARFTRTVSCRRDDGQSGDDSLCLEPKPVLEKDEVDSSACGAVWKSGEWGEYGSTCSANSTRTRDVWCERDDGQRIPNGDCGGNKPESSESTEIFTGCGYSWDTGDWSSQAACSASAMSTRDVYCKRSDGTRVEDGSCNAATKPASSEQTGNYENCTYGWRDVPTGRWDSTCSATARQEVSVSCIRSDNTVADPESCNPASKPSTEIVAENYSSCARQWQYGTWGEWSTTCGATAVRERSASCYEMRPAGPFQIPDGNCDAGQREPIRETSAIYSGCPASWSYGPWGWNGVSDAKSSACSAAPQQTRASTCRKLTADGYETRPEAECGTRENVSRNLPADYDSCSYKWVPGPWGSWSSTCSAAATRTRTTQCYRLDGGEGTSVGPGWCDPQHADASTSETGPNVTDCGGLVKNGSFESGHANWSNTDNAIVTDAYMGTKAMRVGAMVTQTVSMSYTPATNFTISFQCKQITNPVGYAVYRVQLQNQSGASMHLFSPTCTSTTYQEKTTSFKPTVSGSTFTVRIFPVDSGTANKGLIDHLVVTAN